MASEHPSSTHVGDRPARAERISNGAECPFPALAVVDLRLVVCRALCVVTCALYWACGVCQGFEPLRLPSARQA